jgi:uroporphyrinogen-III synthase
MSAPAESSPLSNVRVAFFESRLADATADLIQKHGGIPVRAPALKEVALADNRDAISFAEALIAGKLDLVIFETGVGVRFLAQAMETRFARETWLEALALVRIVARGPKPATALRELGARIDVHVPSPNTWRETLAALDSHLPVAGLHVAVQEYGKPSIDLIDGLERRGAIVTPVSVYRWALPDDLAPLRAAISAITLGQVGAAVFTSAQQVEHLLEIASSGGQEPGLRAALSSSTIVASIGPTTSEALRQHGLPVDIEPEIPKLGHLIAALAARWREAIKAKLP